MSATTPTSPDTTNNADVPSAPSETHHSPVRRKARTRIDPGALLVREGSGRYRVAAPQEVLQRAEQLLGEQLRGAEVLSSPTVVRDYLRMKVGALEFEVFGVLYLDSQNRLLECVTHFAGTLTQTSVYPREIVKAALARNAGGTVLFHNHPSQCESESRADVALTKALSAALALVDVRVLDHLIVTNKSVLSFAEKGLL
jgi:DNA repair protein RadC